MNGDVSLIGSGHWAGVLGSGVVVTFGKEISVKKDGEKKGSPGGIGTVDVERFPVCVCNSKRVSVKSTHSLRWTRLEALSVGRCHSQRTGPSALTTQSRHERPPDKVPIAGKSSHSMS